MHRSPPRPGAFVPRILVLAFACVAAVTPAASAAERSAAPAMRPFFSGNPGIETFRSDAEAELRLGQDAVDHLVGVRGNRTIDNTVVPYNEAVAHAENVAYAANLMESVHPDSAFRISAEALTQAATKFLDALNLNRSVYEALHEVDVSKADEATKHFMMRTLRDFRRSGVDKDEPTRKTIAALLEELVKTSQEFDRNIRNDSRKVSVGSTSELGGLPEDYVQLHPPAADGTITLTIENPDYFPVMRYAKSEDLRRRMMHESLNRAYPTNMAVLDSLIAKRDRLAKILGYPDWADYITEDKMIGNAQNAADFIQRLNDTTLKRAREEYASYLKRKQEDDPAATQVNRWEMAYYGRLIRKRDYDFDPQEVRPYFPFQSVKQGVLDVTSKMFGLTYKRIPDAAVWHPSVGAYEVWDGHKLLGRFFLDLHPRPGKYNHAAKFGIRQGARDIQIPEHALVCNFPGGRPDDPGLMEHSDVETFFHEFGHLLHSILGSQGRWEPIAGTQTERDFVEAPSQMLEEWCWDASVLRTFAKHHQTGEPIPVEVVRKMRRADAFGRALTTATQAFYSAVSLNIYNRPPSEVNTDRIITELEPQYTPVPPMPETHMQTSFGHFDHYSAYYYTYMWSLVISKDMFNAFDKRNLLDQKIAKRYRDVVLSPGGSRPAKALVRDFLNREYDFRAFDDWLADRE